MLPLLHTSCSLLHVMNNLPSCLRWSLSSKEYKMGIKNPGVKEENTTSHFCWKPQYRGDISTEGNKPKDRPDPFVSYSEKNLKIILVYLPGKSLTIGCP